MEVDKSVRVSFKRSGKRKGGDKEASSSKKSKICGQNNVFSCRPRLFASTTSQLDDHLVEVTKKLPYENITLVQAAVGVVQKVNAWGLRPTIPKHTLPKLVDLLENYWQQDPVLRPDFTEIIRILQQIVKEVVLFFLVSQ
ncbi:hypothetical protein AgCh_008121 [Apium graveolens]